MYVEWEVIGTFRYDDDRRLAEEWVQTDYRSFLTKLGVTLTESRPHGSYARWSPTHTRRSVMPLTTSGVCSMSAHSALWKALVRPTSKGAGHSEEATTTRGLDGHP